jgi:hypothetical protein
MLICTPIKFEAKVQPPCYPKLPWPSVVTSTPSKQCCTSCQHVLELASGRHGTVLHFCGMQYGMARPQQLEWSCLDAI